MMDCDTYNIGYVAYTMQDGVKTTRIVDCLLQPQRTILAVAFVTAWAFFLINGVVSQDEDERECIAAPLIKRINVNKLQTFGNP